jgi:hypothetical protein
VITKIYAGAAALLLSTYAGTALLGWEVGSNKQEQLPASARQAPGGYRSFHFWHSGYSGGK